jgi:ABC-type transport system involved in Fe-S cluster assembly fused permease/ATPase subunit
MYHYSFYLQITQHSLQKQIGVVPQDTVLFNQDIRYNIRYGNQDAHDVDVLDAAEAADIHNRILSFPEGERYLFCLSTVVRTVQEFFTYIEMSPLI